MVEYVHSRQETLECQVDPSVAICLLSDHVIFVTVPLLPRLFHLLLFDVTSVSSPLNSDFS